MKMFRAALIAAALSLVPSIALASDDAADNGAAEPIVIILSWDGFRHDYLDRAEFPALGRIVEQGVRAERLVPVFPANTFPNHVALATGAHTDRHGIMDNVFIDRERGLYSKDKDGDWLDAEPIWAAAERQGITAAVFFWVGSETDWRGTGATFRKTPFDGDVGEAEKVDQILAWLDLPARERPRLIMAWWHGADGVGHLKGPNHPGIVEQLHEQDAHLARMLEGIDARGIWDHTTLLIGSDHGMAEVTEQIPVKEPLAAAGIAARVIPSSATANIYLENTDDEAEALRVLREIPNVEVYTQASVPDALRVRHAKRTGDLMLVTTPPRTFYEAGWIRRSVVWAGAIFLDWKPGMHGYHPEHPDMGAVFLGMGRGVPRGRRLGAVSSLDVAPTIARLLGIDPPASSEGRPIPELSPE